MDDPVHFVMPALFDWFCWFDDGLQRTMREAGFPEVSRAQSLVMVNVVRGTNRPNELAKKLRVSRQAVHVTLKQMSEKGIIDLRPDDANSRFRIVQFTELGMAMRKRAAAFLGEATEEIRALLGSERSEVFFESLSFPIDRAGVQR
ncbi:hypothetical protein B5C34_15670 [Pacificimonas flava]|uniref:HTH marR-type domain-containing protein n=2 Tax=Pacificimonas TaxID=1960290 RepID=A0A219B0T5_9SPHN|nr:MULTISPECIES: MarR family winged helix-turn-helix transcriptional regulator [Pacificimonas]MBZ6379596.1 winged helix-turn-helix transcriptional regulator [Pacificimonas aurantium]OWV31931.1 hypothetical protein B5C34_15670 [Pacificimonas flava]